MLQRLFSNYTCNSLLHIIIFALYIIHSIAATMWLIHPTCSVHVYSTCVQYVCTVHVYSTCVQYMCTVYVYSTCVRYMCTVHVYSTCVQYCTVDEGYDHGFKVQH